MLSVKHTQPAIRRIGCLLVFVLLGSLWLCAIEARAAASDQAVTKRLSPDRDSVVWIESKLWDGSETVYAKRRTNGFVIDRTSSGVDVLTVSRPLVYTKAEQQEIRAAQSIPETETMTESLDVVFAGDLHVEAAVVATSKARQLSVLHVNRSLAVSSALRFLPKDSFAKRRAFLLSYPSLNEAHGAEFYAPTETVITKGFVTQRRTAEPIHFLTYHADVPKDAAGGPVLDAEGALVGILLSDEKDGRAAVLSGDEIRAFLETLAIPTKEAPSKKAARWTRRQTAFAIADGAVGLLLCAQIRRGRRRTAEYLEELG